MNTKFLSVQYDHISPAGAEVRAQMANSLGSIAHCTLIAGKTTQAVVHKTVSEFWHIISGNGEIWRRQDKSEFVTPLEPGVTIDIPVGTDFQYRCLGEENLVFLCVTLPPWPGADEVRYLDRGAWSPTVGL